MPAPPPPPNDRPLAVLLLLAVFVALAAGTQFAAWRFECHPNLGRPLIVPAAETVRIVRGAAVVVFGIALAAAVFPVGRGAITPLLFVAICLAMLSVGQVYAPHSIALWQLANADQPAAAVVLRKAWVIVAITAVGLTFLITRSWRHRRDPVPSASHGSARWGDGGALRRDSGLLLGWHGAVLLRYAGEGHVLTVAPTRSGKGVSCVIPNLLEHQGSVIVTDPKGENFAVTSRWRREGLGQAVHAFDPFGVVASRGMSAGFNPLDLIDTASVRSSAEAIDDARLIADMLVLPQGGTGGREGEQAFWNEEARGVLTGLVLHVAASAPTELRTLTHVRSLLTLPPDAFGALLVEMSESEAAGGLVARASARILQKAEKERSGVISTAQSHTHFLDSPRMARVLGQSTLDLGALKRGGVSVYLVLPSDRLEGYSRWLRLMIACSLLAVQRERGQPRERVLFLLDEFAHLGRMQPVVRDIGLAGGYGLTFWLVVQDLSQLKSTYGDAWPTFLANVDVLQAFGTNDWDTAEYLSKLTGEATVLVRSANESRGVSRGRHPQSQHGAALTTAERGRRLLLPDEVRRLDGGLQLLFAKGVAPVLARRLDYLRDKEFAGRADVNPLYALQHERERT